MLPKKKRTSGRVTSKARLRAADISDVETGLAAVRTETVILGAPVGEKEDAELFFIDQKGFSGSSSIKNKSTPKPLRIDEIICPNGRIAALIKPRPTLDVSRSETVLVRKMSKNVKKIVKPENKLKVYDLWESELPTNTLASRKFTKPIVTLVPAVKLPDAGASYNPDTVAHNRLMQVAADEAIQEWKTEEQLSTSNQTIQRALLMSDLSTGGMLIEENVDSSENPIFTKNVPITRKKNRQARNKEKRLRRAVQLENKIKFLEIQATEIDAIYNNANSSVESSPEDRKTKKSKRISKEHLRMTMMRRLRRASAGVPFKAAPIAVKLPEEIPKSLLDLRPESSALVLDRFKNLQERALIECIPSLGHLSHKSNIHRSKIIPKYKQVLRYSYKQD